jgi:hypothetical protein
MKALNFKILLAMEGKNYTRWSESMKNKLAVQVLRHNGYKRTGDTMEKKWIPGDPVLEGLVGFAGRQLFLYVGVV